MVVVGLIKPALALSCYGTEDRFIFRCDAAQQCKAGFRAREIQTAGGCARRVVVEKTPADVQLAIQQQLDAPLLAGTYEVTLVHRYYSDPPLTAQELKQAFSERSLLKPKMNVRVLAENSDLGALEDEWTQRERTQYLKMLGFWVIEGSLLLLFLVSAFATTRSFRKRLRAHGRSNLLLPVLIQAVFFAAALFSLLSLAMPSLIALTAPLWIGVWLYEAGALARSWLEGRQAEI